VSVAGLPAAAVAIAARAAPAALGARRVGEVRAGAECGCGCGRICACVSSFLRASCGLTCAELKTGATAASIGAAVGATGSNASASAASGGAAAAGGGDAAPSAAPSFAPSTTAFPCCPLAHALRQPLGRLCPPGLRRQPRPPWQYCRPTLFRRSRLRHKRRETYVHCGKCAARAGHGRRVALPLSLIHISEPTRLM
jgi:hypothetical protein